MPGIALAELTFIVPCMGRLAHLQQTLPRMLALAPRSVIVVDYACPELSGDWVEAHYPAARVVRVRGVGTFNLAAARNAGAAVATGAWLCFIDADVEPADDFAAEVSRLADAPAFYTVAPATRGLSGTVICPRGACARIGGYDDTIAGWGSEDTDFYLRLQFAGFHRAYFNATTLRSIPHDDALRTQHYGGLNTTLSLSINAYYTHAKLDLMKLGGRELSARARAALYSRIAAQVTAALERGEPGVIEVPVGQQPLSEGWEISSSLRYRVAPRRGPMR